MGQENEAQVLSSIQQDAYQQDVLCCVRNIELLLEDRTEYPALEGPLRVYGPPKCISAALELSVRYLITYVKMMECEWECWPIEFRLRVVEAFDRAIARLGWGAEREGASCRAARGHY
jgi:hypothetical protein